MLYYYFIDMASKASHAALVQQIVINQQTANEQREKIIQSATDHYDEEVLKKIKNAKAFPVYGEFTLYNETRDKHGSDWKSD